MASSFIQTHELSNILTNLNTGFPLCGLCLVEDMSSPVQKLSDIGTIKNHMCTVKAMWGVSMCADR